MEEIKLTTLLNLEDSQFQQKTKNVLRVMKTLTSQRAFLKLKFDEKDFRKQIQQMVAESQKELSKAFGVKNGEPIRYTGPKGGQKVINTRKQMLEAQEYSAKMMQDKTLSAAIRGVWEKRFNAISNSLNLADDIKELDRLARAAQSGRVANVRRRAYLKDTEAERNERSENARFRREALAKEREAERQQLAASKQAEKEQRDIEKRKTDALRAETKKRITLRRQETQANKDSGRWVTRRQADAESNRIINGDNSNQVLASMRSYYTEQEKASKSAERASIRQANIQNRIIRQYQQQYGIMGGLASRMSRYFSIYTVAAFGKKVAEITGYFEKQQVALEGILGSSSKAQELVTQIKSFALQSPFQTKELITFTKQLSAFSIPADELFETTKRLADISAGLGVDMGRIILAYGQVRAASVLRGQELRQFTEAGIPLVDKLREKFEQLRGEVVTNADVFEMISKRQVSFKMVSDVLMDMTKEGGKFYKMQEKITDTLYGQMQKLQDLWTIEMDKLGKGSGSFFMGVVKLLQLIVKNVRGVATGLLVAFTLDWPIRNIRKMRMEWELMDVQVKKSIGSYRQFKRLRLLEFGKNLGWGVAAAGIGVAVGAIYNHYQKLHKVERDMKEISDSFNKETNKMIGGFDAIVVRLRAAKVGTQAYNDAIETLRTNYGEFLNVTEQTVQTLIAEQKATAGNVSEFQKLREELAAAIKLKQEWNELNAKKESSATSAIEGAAGSSFWGTGYHAINRAAINLFSNLLAGGKSNKKKDKALNELFGTQYEEDVSKMIIEDLDNIVKESYSEFTTKGLTSIDDFKKIFETAFSNKFLSNTLDKSSEESIKNWIDRVGNAFYSLLTNEDGWGEYTKTVKKLGGEGTDLLASLVRINKIFDKYNPGDNSGEGAVGKYNWTQNEYKQLLKEAAEKEFSILADNDTAKDKLSSLIQVADKGSIREITAAIDDFFNSIQDASRRAVISDAKKRFVEGTDALTVQEEELALRIENAKTWEGIIRGVVNNVDMQQFIDKYNPAALGEQTVQQTRDKIAKDYSELEKELKEYTKNAELFKDDIALINAKMQILKRLAKPDLYAVDLTKKNGRGTVQIPLELTEFLNKLKDAYTTYRTATQAEGASMGIEYMRNDPKMREKFANLFAGGMAVDGHDIFKDENGNDIKLNGKTITEILTGGFLDGLEDGVVDFGEAVKRLVYELEAVGKKGKGFRQYLNAAKQLSQWWEQTSSKDNVQGWIAEMNRQIKELGRTFENTNRQTQTYRELMKNGTTSSLSRFVGGNSGLALTPNSSLLRTEIRSLMEAYNSMLTQVASQSLKEGEVLDESRLNFLDPDIVESAKDIPGAIALLEKVTEYMKLNRENFGLETYGETGKRLDAKSNELLNTIKDELVSLSGEIYSGSVYEDAFANAMRKVSAARKTLERENNISGEYGNVGRDANMKRFMDVLTSAVKETFDGFMESQSFEVMMQAMSNFGSKPIKIEEALEKFEQFADSIEDKTQREMFRSNIDEFRSKILEFNAKGAAIGAIRDNMQMYRNADIRGLQRFNAVVDRGTVAGGEYDKENNQFKITADMSEELREQLTAANIELAKMGPNGAKLAKELRDAALSNVGEALSKAQKALGSMTDAANSMISSFKSMSSLALTFQKNVSKSHDARALEDMNATVDDLTEGFGAAISVITSMIAVMQALNVMTTVLGITVAASSGILMAFVAAGLIIGGIIAAAKQHDRDLEHDIEDLQKKIEATDRAIKQLQETSNRTSGWARLRGEIEATALSFDKYTDALKQANLEAQKKDADEDKIQDYKDNAENALNDMLDGLKQTRDDFIGSVDDWASSLGNALRSAFQNGENAVRAFRNTATEMIGDIVEKILEIGVIQPIIEEATRKFIGFSLNKEDSDYIGNDSRFKNADGSINAKAMADYVLSKFKDTDNLRDFKNTIIGSYGSVMDAINSMGSEFNDWAYNSSQSALQSGIQGVTEDTARTLEGLSNSMLAQLVIGNQLLRTTLLPLADIQARSFNTIITQQRDIREHTMAINRAIDEMRNGTRPLKVAIA